ncbi:hypothetical protein GYA49_00815 [Candidatus Beckwithbacteria bacterium]|nr:hypothetical protein [Candidatus Beckwithbacteria bacterium]
MMETSIELMSGLAKIIVFVYGFISLLVLIYGIKSIIAEQTVIWRDDEGNYAYSKKITIIKSILHGSFSPFIYPRIFPRESESYYGSSAKFLGVLYIILGLFMLTPFIWAVLAFHLI